MPLNFLNLIFFSSLNISKRYSYGLLISGNLYGATAKPTILRIATFFFGRVHDVIELD